MSVWRNFFLGQEPTRGVGPLRRLDAASARRETRQALDEMGIALTDVDRPVGAHSGGERQAIAIARARQQQTQTVVTNPFGPPQK